MKIRMLGAHSNETSSSRCVSILVDNNLAIDAGALTSTLTIKEQSKVDTIMLTHAHFDHIKDVPLFALNAFRTDRRIDIYALQIVNSTIKKNLLNGQVYPELHALPADKPTIRFHNVTPFKEYKIGRYRVKSIPVHHNGKTIGYHVSDDKGKSFFYTSDTGPGLNECWQHVSCQLLVIDTSFPNSYRRYAFETGHLTPDLLFVELSTLRKIQGELPQIVIVHSDPLLEDEIRREISDAADALGTPITLASEGMQFTIR